MNGQGEVTKITRKPILCVDFDGVLHSYDSGWKGAGIVQDGPVPGAVEFLMKAIVQFEVHIYSSRSSSYEGVVAMRSALRNWIAEAGYPESLAQAMTFDSEKIDSALKFPTSKPSALVTIDDRAITFNGVFPSIESLLEFQPWNKKITPKVQVNHSRLCQET